MKFIFILVLCCGMVSRSMAQMVVLMNPETGKVFEISKYADVSGSPFLIEEWMDADVQTSKGVYRDLRVKFDVYDQVLYFEKNNQLFSFLDPVLQFTLKPNSTDSSAFRHFVRGLNGVKGYAEQIASGRLSFYRSDLKLLSEVNEINRGVIKTFNTSIRYYFKDARGIHLVRLSEKEVLGYLTDRMDQVMEFKEAKKLNLRKERDVAELLRYYNQ